MSRDLPSYIAAKTTVVRPSASWFSARCSPHWHPGRCRSSCSLAAHLIRMVYVPEEDNVGVEWKKGFASRWARDESPCPGLELTDVAGGGICVINVLKDTIQLGDNISREIEASHVLGQYFSLDFVSFLPSLITLTKAWLFESVLLYVLTLLVSVESWQNMYFSFKHAALVQPTPTYGFIN